MDLQPWYVTGLVDGEGSFLVSFTIRNKMRMGVETRPSFTVSQHERSHEVITSLKDYFNCGSIRYNKTDHTYKYEVRSLDDLVEKIIPHFISYPLNTSKKKDFDAFRCVCESMKLNKHLNSNGMREIISTAYQMNNIGARRYQKREILTICEKMKV